MYHVKARKIRQRFVRRFSDLRLFDVKLARLKDWRDEVPNYDDREGMTIGRVPASRNARRYWDASAVDHAS